MLDRLEVLLILEKYRNATSGIFFATEASGNLSGVAKESWRNLLQFASLPLAENKAVMEVLAKQVTFEPQLRLPPERFV